eukprot:Gregarina_sp_Poly_1__5844@NODE_307_length_9710_cov_52_151094_g264_i0_p2_GENE_NODE_307_length_9710_cov_52_151094_g264_i0NODE_307_length_9710_cov_52_151094_g264_i0_p2_ORF_typecomplete_len954_score134_91Vac14_Fab1_bd/PF12755_7/1_4e03Vac14_Fab1_bd/PF12755_7/1_8e04Vac14_Fab1_bd/PF12755_7/3_1e03Vac14_Fab1_bd/PF12755_7/6_4e02Vac14_Fab1_bd/PF12755_7/6_7e02Vac14_Fab1_bd/PF12755_7/1_7Vac14_Fab1_bd/PF12755_7/6_7e02_NODE_307_length_9710_cov_52_151094_g264_i01572862
MSELIPYLSDVIDGPPSYPLMPPTFIEDNSSLGSLLAAGSASSELKGLASEAAVLAARSESAGSVVEPVIQDISVNAGRPPLASIGNTPDARATLFRAVIGTSENDFVYEVIAQQLKYFVPKLIELQDSVLVIGLLCQLASSAEVTVRDEAVISILEILKLFDNKTLLSSGCVDLFLGMATSDNPYKKASVAFLLPPLLSILSGYRSEDEEAVRPLKIEIVKLFFDIASGTSTAARRAFALNFGPMAMTLMMQPSSFKYTSFALSKQASSLRQTLGLKHPENFGLTPLELELCLVPHGFLEDPNPEMRLLALSLILTVALILFLKYARPPSLDRYPTLRCLLRQSESHHSAGRVPDIFKQTNPSPARCPACQFTWTASSCICGVFSLSFSPSFESLRFALGVTGYISKAMASPPLLNPTGYRKLVTEVILPVFQRSLVDEWIIRVVLIDAFPFLLDLILSQLTPREVENYIESNWLTTLADDEHTDVRAIALHKFALYAWLYSQSTARGCLEMRTQRTPLDDSQPVSAVEWPTEFSSFDGLHRFVDRCSHILQAAASDADSKLRLAAADLAPQFLLLLTDPHQVADYFVSPFLSLFRDLDNHVVLSALGALRVLTWSSLKHRNDKERYQEQLLMNALQSRLPVGIRSPLLPRTTNVEEALPLDPAKSLNSLETTKKYIGLMERCLIPAVANCLVASTTSQVSGEAPPSVIALWRVRCAALHLLPMLDEVVGFTSLENQNDESRPYFGDLLKSVRNALFENTAVVRRCAAQATVRLCARARSPGFTSLLFQQIFQQCLLRYDHPSTVDGRTRATRLSVCLIGEALATYIREEGVIGSREEVLRNVHWSLELFNEMMECLRFVCDDKVANIKMLAQKAAKTLASLNVLSPTQSKILDRKHPES